MQPTARTDGLTAKKLGTELVVFDANNGSVHFLNRVAEVVWRACDGRTDPAGLARIVARVTDVPDAGPAVELALEQLSRRGLLVTPVARADADRRRGRRDALKHLATALAIPVVLTVTAQKARAAGASVCMFRCPNGSQVFGFSIKGICTPATPCPTTATNTTTTTTTTSPPAERGRR